jgi:hypothetical protein
VLETRERFEDQDAHNVPLPSRHANDEESIQKLLQQHQPGSRQQGCAPAGRSSFHATLELQSAEHQHGRLKVLVSSHSP